MVSPGGWGEEVPWGVRWVSPGRSPGRSPGESSRGVPRGVPWGSPWGDPRVWDRGPQISPEHSLARAQVVLTDYQPLADPSTRPYQPSYGPETVRRRPLCKSQLS